VASSVQEYLLSLTCEHGVAQVEQPPARNPARMVPAPGPWPLNRPPDWKSPADSWHFTLIESGADAKTFKGERYGWVTGVLYLAPDVIADFWARTGRAPTPEELDQAKTTQRGKYKTTCPFAGQCAKVCTFTTGRAELDPNIGNARIRKTLWYQRHPQSFVQALREDLAKLVARAAEMTRARGGRRTYRVAVRLNGTSDIAWERVAPELFREFPEVQFYDYTKIAARLRAQLPPNYHLTYSSSERDTPESLAKVAKTSAITVVFDINARRHLAGSGRAARLPLPPTWSPTLWGEPMPVFDADLTDLRFLDGLPGVVLGLRRKGRAADAALKAGKFEFIAQEPFLLGRGRVAYGPDQFGAFRIEQLPRDARRRNPAPTSEQWDLMMQTWRQHFGRYRRQDVDKDELVAEAAARAVAYFAGHPDVELRDPVALARRIASGAGIDDLRVRGTKVRKGERLLPSGGVETEGDTVDPHMDQYAGADPEERPPWRIGNRWVGGEEAVELVRGALTVLDRADRELLIGERSRAMTNAEKMRAFKARRRLAALLEKRVLRWPRRNPDPEERRLRLHHLIDYALRQEALARQAGREAGASLRSVEPHRRAAGRARDAVAKALLREQAKGQTATHLARRVAAFLAEGLPFTEEQLRGTFPELPAPVAVWIAHQLGARGRAPVQPWTQQQEAEVAKRLAQLIATHGGTRRNPDLVILGNPTEEEDPEEIDAAAQAFEEFHGVEPRAVRRIGRGRKALVALGDLKEIVYKPTRGERSGPAWFHEFGPGAVLAASVDGKELRIVKTGGRSMKVDWQRGIVG